jgi:purine-binding chemotaxis protein CheW
MSEGNLADGRKELISFRVGTQEFCVDIMSVREIRGWTPATSMPNSPGYVRGVINLRGAVLPVIDLAARLGLEAEAPTDRSVIIVTRIDKRTVGMLVDAVSDILTVTDEVIQAPPDVGCETARTFIKGILAMDGRMISLISIADILPAEQEMEAA